MDKLMSLCMAGVVCFGMAVDGAFDDKLLKRTTTVQSDLS
jgi:hypothetical protein